MAMRGLAKMMSSGCGRHLPVEIYVLLFILTLLLLLALVEWINGDEECKKSLDESNFLKNTASEELKESYKETKRLWKWERICQKFLIVMFSVLLLFLGGS